MRVYLDHQSACPLLPEVREAMLPFLNREFGHPGSLHQAGVVARQAVQAARERIAALLNAESEETILFTGSGAEAMNLAVKGAVLAARQIGRHIVLSAAEQPGVTESVKWLESVGCTATKVPVDAEGRISPDKIAEAIQPDTALVCLHHANLDIGTIQPIERIGRHTAKRGLLLFVDATASAGWISIDVQRCNIDLLALTPHRFYGPKGTAALYRHRRARIAPVIHGAELESAENVAGIVGAGMAAELAARRLPEREAHTRRLQTLFLEEAARSIRHFRLNGPPPGPDRLPANLNLSVEFVEGEGLALMLDVKGVALASGAACVTQTMRMPPVLAAIGVPESLARGNLVVSFGEENTEEEVRFAVETLTQAVTALREMSPAWDDFQQGRLKSRIP